MSQYITYGDGFENVAKKKKNIAKTQIFCSVWYRSLTRFDISKGKSDTTCWVKIA